MTAEKIEELENEKVLLIVRANWLSYLGELIVGILTIPILGLGIILLIKTCLKRHNHKCTVTNKKLIVEEGILSKIRDIIPLNNIRTLKIKQKPLERLLNQGTVILSVPGGDKNGLPINRIPRPDILVDVINQNRK